MRFSLLLAALVLASCTHLRSEDETVAEHRRDAAHHEAVAHQEEAKYDPGQVDRPVQHLPRIGQDGVPDFGGEAFNPTEEHLRKADREMIAANEHLAAAKKLVAFEDRACAGVPAEERSACPLFPSQVARVETTKTGFVLTFRPNANVAKVHQMLSCHLAYAVATGFDQPSCPLFVKGTALDRVGRDGIAFVGETKAVAEALHAQARRVFLGVD